MARGIPEGPLTLEEQIHSDLLYDYISTGKCEITVGDITVTVTAGMNA